MKAFITKYALTRGIIEVDDAEVYNSGKSIRVPSLGAFAHFHAKQWNSDRESAMTRAAAIKLARIESREREIKKLVNLEIKVTKR